MATRGHHDGSVRKAAREEKKVQKREAKLRRRARGKSNEEARK
jgi:hypothetical protein